MAHVQLTVDDSPTTASPSELVGYEVEIHGLVGRPELNGRIGMAIGKSGGDRVGVSVLGLSEPIALKPSNLKRRPRMRDMEQPEHHDEDKAILKSGNPSSNDCDPCGDGDQSMLTDGRDQGLREVWARGADLNPWLHPGRYSTFFAACAWGDVQAVKALLREGREELERRESKLRYSPLHVCVAGSRVVYGSTDWPKRDIVGVPRAALGILELVPEHCAVAKCLIERRARVDSRDILGHTPLALACGTHATDGSLKVARVLADGGASLHAVDRFQTPLLATVMCRPHGGVRYDVVEALLQMGADPDRMFEYQQLKTTLSMRMLAQKFLIDRNAGKRLLELFAKYSKQTGDSQASTLADLSQPSTLKDLAMRVGRSAIAQEVAESGPKAAAAPRLEYGTRVRIGRLVSRAELNGARGYILGFTDGRYEVELAKDGAQMRLKPDNIDEDTSGGDDDACIDPRKLRKWGGLGVTRVSSITGTSHAAVEWCFNQAMPPGAKMAMAHPIANEKRLAPFAQWVYSLLHIILNWESGLPTPDGNAARCWRIVLEDDDETENITIDFLDTTCECPPYVPAVQPTLPDAPAKKLRCGAPLLPIRYLHNSKGAPDFKARLAVFSGTMPGARDPVTAHASKRMGCECSIGKVHSASVAEIAAALENLSANETMLSAEYRKWFFTTSPHHGESSGFRPSFIVPPMEPMATKPSPVCVGCNQRQGEHKFQQCERCGSYFCSKECLRANWKEHKKVCRKTEEKLQPPTEEMTRKSVLFDLRPDPARGTGFANFSMTGAASQGPRLLDPSQAPKNIHGKREFVVKVQPPGVMASGETACMVYDESRSFQSFLPLATHGIEAVLQRIHHYGVHNERGSKGYFYARREGTRLRIFADKILPPQAW